MRNPCDYVDRKFLRCWQALGLDGPLHGGRRDCQKQLHSSVAMVGGGVLHFPGTVNWANESAKKHLFLLMGIL